jgi:hypothetical protein
MDVTWGTRHPMASGSSSTDTRPSRIPPDGRSFLSAQGHSPRCCCGVSWWAPTRRGSVADEPKQPWLKSIPGVLTAATGFIAALSGLVAGLNQLGVFQREPAPAVVGVSPMTRDNTAQDTSPRLRTSPPGTSVVEPAPNAARPPSPTPVQRPAEPTPAGAPKPVPSRTDSTSLPAVTRLARGTVLELTVPARTCAPEDGQRRFTAQLASPVRADGATLLPAGTTAVLHLRRGGNPAAPRARLDSLVRPDLAVAVPTSQVQIPRGSVNGTCLRADARMSAVLGASLSLPPR